MISGIVVACMAIFMVIGAADKALFNNRFGYGEEFERGLAAMGPLAMCLVGIMCAAPAVGRAVAPFRAGAYETGRFCNGCRAFGRNDFWN